jgi:hypothetical protein
MYSTKPSKHYIFDFDIDKDRLECIIAQVKMHAGLNNLLSQKGFEPIANSKMTIEVTRQLGIIDSDIYTKCIEINTKGNHAKHKWKATNSID